MDYLSSLMSNIAITAPLSSNPNRDVEVALSPDDSVVCMAFSPPSITENNFLIAGSWDGQVRCWEIGSTGSSIPRMQQSMTDPVMDVAWRDEGGQVFMAGCDQTAKVWDLNANQYTQVDVHDAPIKTCHWIHAPKFNCLMTGSLDKTVKFWDLRQQQPIVTLKLPERISCSDVDVNVPIAVVSAGREIRGYLLETNPPQMTKIALMNAPDSDHRCLSIFRNKEGEAAGLAVGYFGGQVAIRNFATLHPSTDNYNFMLYPSPAPTSVNDIKFHPKCGTMATAGSDGTYSFWNNETRSKLKTSLMMPQPVTSCCFSHDGKIFAYSVGYDWAKGVESNNPEQKKSTIFLHSCLEEMNKPAGSHCDYRTAHKSTLKAQITNFHG